MSSTYAQHDIGQLYGKFDYTRAGNPTREAVEKLIGGIEFAKYCITYSSGCAGITSIFHMLKAGDHVISCDDVYGGTQRYMRLYARDKFGLKVDLVDQTNLDNITNLLTPETKVIWIETPSNPTIKIVNIKKVCEIAKKHGAITVVDNTFATPCLQSPILLGADLVFHSCTKFLGGHMDVVMGAVATNDEDLYKRLFAASISVGGCPSPFDCFLMNRGIKTLPLRVAKSTENAYTLAHLLQKHELVEEVIYPGLESHPYHSVAKEQMRGFGGMLSIRLKGKKPQVSKFLRSLKYVTLGKSLGGVQSLAEVPEFMTHVSVPPETRVKLGITENLIRISFGIESTEDLVADFIQALEASQKADE